MRNAALLIILALLGVPAAAAVTVHGTVHAATGEALPGVSVWIKGSALAVTTDAKGAFELSADSLPAVVVAYLGGFDAAEVHVVDDQVVSVTLKLSAITESVTVNARAPRADASSSFDIKSLDIIKTPGAQADLFRALQMMPGVAKVDEGAGLFVRGGDVSEVRVFLDGATIAHPFRYESPTGGQFGTVTPMLLEGVAFSTGGFSARFGNALSAVLDLRGLGRPSSSQLLLTGGLAGLSGRASLKGSDESGLRVSGNVTSTHLLFEVNGQPRQFDQTPGGFDLNGSAHYNSQAYGTLKFFAMTQSDHVGVELQKEGFDGFLHSSSRQAIGTASWKKTAGDWLLTSALGFDQYSRTTDAGVLDLRMTDRRLSWRFDALRGFGRALVRTGIDADGLSTLIAGIVSIRGGDFGGVSGTKTFNVDHRDAHSGAYVEIERPFGIVTPTLGVRVDHNRLIDGITIDPRANAAIALPRKQTLRIAWGIYHQSPSADYFDRGAPTRLDSMRAEHWILGWETGSIDGPLFARVEAYKKKYTSLPLDASGGGFTSDGYGDAHGIDIYLQKKWTRLELRGGASLLDAARRWTPSDQQQRFALPAGTWRPDFDIPRTLGVASILHATKTIDIGTNATYASGHPHTPIVGGEMTNYGYAPVYGAINSERLPPYIRADANVSYRSHIGSDFTVIYFAAVSNVTARENFSDYAYSTDYSRRTPIVSAHPRSFYFGFTIFR